ncbi:hypothetical protein SAMN04487897_101927 [Paenibacillus sp. yr247]|uniref:hypothetical protein n=1 Tax=Paenibacillus sp. yr247 TaxID=1761880 RepID=UPI00088BE54B|nr:hypothetical protein [Paenibacillus sp. yr247]SDN05644.1 hypothetical protein SAMN04487897_101927 [Paenibacillus sp. yr247]
MNLNATLIAWNAGALNYSVAGVTQTSIVVGTTTTHLAALNHYPNDPILPIVTRWNALIEATKGPSTFGQTNLDLPNTFSGITGELATAGANMQIHIEPHSNIVASLRPIPVIPPNPIKSINNLLKEST